MLKWVLPPWGWEQHRRTSETAGHDLTMTERAHSQCQQTAETQALGFGCCWWMLGQSRIKISLSKKLLARSKSTWHTSPRPGWLQKGGVPLLKMCSASFRVWHQLRPQAGVMGSNGHLRISLGLLTNGQIARKMSFVYVYDHYSEIIICSTLSITEECSVKMTEFAEMTKLTSLVKEKTSTFMAV